MADKDPNGYPVTGWYIEGFGARPVPAPVTDFQKLGAQMLALPNFDDIFEIDPADPPLDMPDNDPLPPNFLH